MLIEDWQVLGHTPGKAHPFSCMAGKRECSMTLKTSTSLGTSWWPSSVSTFSFLVFPTLLPAVSCLLARCQPLSSDAYLSDPHDSWYWLSTVALPMELEYPAWGLRNTGHTASLRDWLLCQCVYLICEMEVIILHIVMRNYWYSFWSFIMTQEINT